MVYPKALLNIKRLNLSLKVLGKNCFQLFHHDPDFFLLSELYILRDVCNHHRHKICLAEQIIMLLTDTSNAENWFLQIYYIKFTIEIKAIRKNSRIYPIISKISKMVFLSTLCLILMIFKPSWNNLICREPNYQKYMNLAR